MILLILFEVAISSIIIPLEDADTKIISDVIVNSSGLLYHIVKFSPIIYDFNRDGIKDLAYITVYWYAYNSYLDFFLGKKEWPHIIDENNADIIVYDTFSNHYLDLSCSAIFNDSLMVVKLMPAPAVPNEEKYILFPFDLGSGEYLIDDIKTKVLINPSRLGMGGIVIPTLTPNYVIYDSFLVTFGMYIDSSYRRGYNVLIFVPLQIDYDTINMFNSSYYKAFYTQSHLISFWSLEHFIYIPGDINGDEYFDIVLLQNFFYCPITCYFADDDAEEVSSHLFNIPIMVGGEIPESHILWGRPTWHGYIDSIYRDRATVRYNTYHFLNGRFIAPAEACDLDKDGLNDIVILAPSIAYYDASDETTLVFPGDTIPGDTSKLFIIYGRRHFPRGVLDSLQNIVDVTIKSNHPNDMIGGPVSIGDYNGDGNQDIFVGASSIFQYMGYLFLGKGRREFPDNFDDADVKIRVDSEYVYNGNWKYTLFNLGSKLCDLNGDGLDDIIIIVHRIKIRNPPPEPVKLSFPFVYIFFNCRPTPSLFHPDTNIIDNPHDSICIKLSFKHPLALHTLLLTVSGDTFTIDSPQVRFSPAESLLCFIPSTEWDTSTIIPFCIERLEDTIGTAMRERWCVRFSDSTWNVYQPPKPRTLSITCYPNPFNAEVRIKLRMPDAGDIKIDIYDISGKLIDHIQKSKLTVGWHELVWRPNISVPSGVYLLKVSAGGKAVVRRVVLVR